MSTPEADAREKIDKMLLQCGWAVQDKNRVNLGTGLGVAVREVPMKSGHGTADYLLFVNGKAAGVIEAKAVGTTLTGVERQSEKYSTGLPDMYSAWIKPLPFLYESTGIETRFTNATEPDARSRPVFAYHRPETLEDWLKDDTTMRERLKTLPPLMEDALWPPQVKAIKNIEESFAANRPRTLVQMATGSGKTFTAVNLVYRLIKFGKVRRVLFLVDRGNLGRQALKEFQQLVTPDDGRKFHELYNIQYLQSNRLDPVCKVSISTIQRLYSMLKGDEDIPSELEEASGFQVGGTLFKQPPPVEYNPDIPIETFDVIITDECHRSIYNLWRQVIEYFDAFILGLTATPSNQTFGFFNRNLVMEYGHEEAVADGVNVNYDVYRIRTEITESGSKVDAGYYIDKRDKLTRQVRWEQLDEELEYESGQLDRDVVAPDQIRTVIQTFRDKVLAETFPGRAVVPKTLIFAKDDSHADDIVNIIREEFGKGNDFCQKITYRTTGVKVEDLIASFRNDYNPRIAVTVDMIATGTDIKPLEIVFFMRMVRSRSFFEQMKGRGVRVIADAQFQSVTPGAKSKTHFIIIDSVGVCEADKTESQPMERQPTVSFSKLLDAVAFGNRESEVLSSIAGRLARLDRQLNSDQQQLIIEKSDGLPLSDIIHKIVESLDPDGAIEKARTDFSTDTPSEEQIQQSAEKLKNEAVAPLAGNPDLRNTILELKQSMEQSIDTISADKIIFAGFDEQALEAARETTRSFKEYIEKNKDEITALQILYSKPQQDRLTFKHVKELAQAIERTPQRWTPDVLWQAYEKLDKSKVQGAGSKRLLTDIVSLVRFAIQDDSLLSPYAEKVNERYENWLAQQAATGKRFTSDQIEWLDDIKVHIMSSMGISTEDFEYSPFAQKGGLGKVYKLFGEELNIVLNELNEALAA
jgi:type I restriction enzyme R subunit